MERKYISWRRVSTKTQGESELGLDSQLKIIKDTIKDSELIADYNEVYTGKELSGCTELWKAINHCKEIGATLIIAKTDRFRNVIEALQIVKMLPDQIRFCNIPRLDAAGISMMLPLTFSFAEFEVKQISIRTKAALKAKKERDGSWVNEYGKYTGTTRAESIAKATKSSAESRKKKAKENPANARFWEYVKQFKHNYSLSTKKDYENLTNQLNKIGLTTATGKEFNPLRTRAMYNKCKNLYRDN